MRSRIFTAFVLSAALLTLCSCSNKESSSSVSPESSASAEITEVSATEPVADATAAESTADEEPTTEQKEQNPTKPYKDGDTIRPGLWQSYHAPTMDYDYEDCVYYELRKDGTGTIVYQENGLTQDFTYGLSGANFFIKFNDVEHPASAEVNFVSADFNELEYDNGYTESWSYLSDTTAADLKFFCNNELTEMARQHYNGNHKKTSDYTEVSYDNGLVSIRLYDNIEDHKLLETYTVDQFSGKGKDSTGAEFDLSGIDLDANGWG